MSRLHVGDHFIMKHNKDPFRFFTPLTVIGLLGSAVAIDFAIHPVGDNAPTITPNVACESVNTDVTQTLPSGAWVTLGATTPVRPGC